MFPRSILVRVGNEGAFGDGNHTETTNSVYMAEYDSGVSASSVSLVDTQDLGAFDDSESTRGTFPRSSPSVSSASSDSESSETPSISRHGSDDTTVPSLHRLQLILRCCFGVPLKRVISTTSEPFVATSHYTPQYLIQNHSLLRRRVDCDFANGAIAYVDPKPIAMGEGRL